MSSHTKEDQYKKKKPVSWNNVKTLENELTCFLINSFVDTKYEEMKAEGNTSTVTEFVFQGFSDLPNLQVLLFGLFIIIYMIVLFGNGLIIIITKFDPALRKPMYFFLGNFSSLEIFYVTVTLPRMLKDLLTKDRSISRVECAIQLYFFATLGSTECLLLAVMSYDRYVAICNPLHYPLVMNHKVCVLLAVGSWTSVIPLQMWQTCQMFSQHFCKSKEIKHYFCDVLPVLKLACGNTSLPEVTVLIGTLLFVIIPFMLILASYSKIIGTILRLPTATGRAKAFSTCSSHLIVVLLFFGSATITYLQPKSMQSPLTEKLLALSYTTVTPMFNPLIYSLRNKEVIAALRKLFLKK
ncbi:olfactory receptor 10AG1-like [Sorex araneus]|uniref:olfactory receptor 10AG1-like n=1 Tax=Sorex araneus TaxID=42254 RepID=UPI002433837C|nr:olfactory receptor 10AG1-like [Sorex araneus]